MKRYRTLDLAGSQGPPSGSGEFHATERIGPKRSKTPEGFLLCKDVPISRTGWMIYAPGEVPVKAGASGYVMIGRDAATLFSDVTIASFNGKPVTNDHPPLGVDSTNWRKHCVGSVHNVRRGTGDDKDVLLADLLITDAAAIAAVESGKREVSAGYDATYEATGDGMGRQVNIIGNHIALVERGRCGPRCAIGDHSPQLSEGRRTMTTQAKPSARPRAKISPLMRQLILDQAAELENDPDENDEGEGPGVHVHIHNGPTAAALDGAPAAEATLADPAAESRFKKLEDGLNSVIEAVTKVTDAIAKIGTSGTPSTAAVTDHEGSGPAGDSAALETGFKAVVADAEVLVPGFAIPTFDAKAQRAATIDTMCSTRRRALDAVYATAEGRTLLNAVTGLQTLDTAALTCVEVAQAFRSAAGAKRLLNNRTSTGDNAGRLPTHQTQNSPAKKGVTIADIQKLNDAAYKH